MKKIVLVVALLFATGIVASAQPHFGVKAGATIARMGVKDLHSRTGFNGGFFVQYAINDSPISMQTELLYNIQGAKYNFGQQGGKGKYELTYITLPMMFQYYIVKGLDIELGPQLGFMTSAKLKPDGGQGIKIKSNLHKLDFALNFGAAYELPMFPLGVYARYSLGLTNISKDPMYNFTDSKGKNRLFQLGLFVKI